MSNFVFTVQDPQSLVDVLKTIGSSDSLSPRINKAIEFATAKHAGQTRKVSGLPYVSHPIAVSAIVATYKKSKRIEELIIAALLHDTLEDTDTTYEELEKVFSPLVASLVHELTDDSAQMRKMGKLLYQQQKMQKMSSYGLVIKLADRLHNIFDNPTPKMITDTLELISQLEQNRQFTETHNVLITQIKNKCRLKLSC
jgi:(p)ppGpp synthase/HD superfamily hydrolase